MTFGLQPRENLLSVSRLNRIDAITIEHFEAIQDDHSVFRTVAPRESTKRISNELLSVGLRHERRECWVFGRNIGEPAAERDPRDHVDDVAEVDALVRPQARFVPE